MTTPVLLASSTLAVVLVLALVRELRLRRALQNLLQRQLAQMQAEVARGASQLVESDAKARAELASLQRDLQQDQTALGRQRDQLETDRRQIAEQRHRDPLIAALLLHIGQLLTRWRILA